MSPGEDLPRTTSSNGIEGVVGLEAWAPGVRVETCDITCTWDHGVLGAPSAFRASVPDSTPRASGGSSLSQQVMVGSSQPSRMRMV